VQALDLLPNRVLSGNSYCFEVVLSGYFSQEVPKL
jgi:hypothetical protein